MRLQLGGEYARVLRVIGEDLQNLFPESLEIRTDGRDFIARGYARSKTSTSANPDVGSSRRTIWQILSRPSPKAHLGPPQPSLIKFERRYTNHDVNELDEVQASRRMDAARKDEIRKPDLHSLKERLRMIGKLLEEKHSELTKMCYDANTISFEYRDGEGKIHQEEYSTLALYKLQQQYYSERRLIPDDAWQQIRARG